MLICVYVFLTYESTKLPRISNFNTINISALFTITHTHTHPHPRFLHIPCHTYKPYAIKHFWIAMYYVQALLEPLSLFFKMQEEKKYKYIYTQRHIHIFIHSHTFTLENSNVNDREKEGRGRGKKHCRATILCMKRWLWEYTTHKNHKQGVHIFFSMLLLLLLPQLLYYW